MGIEIRYAEGIQKAERNKKRKDEISFGFIQGCKNLFLYRFYLGTQH